MDHPFILLPAAYLFCFVAFDWWSRMVFMARGYRRRHRHGKTWKRAHKHYKANWTFWQRMFWVPVFKEEYESRFRFLAYFSFAQLGISIVVLTALCFNLMFWDTLVKISCFYVLFRVIYINWVATGKIQ